MGRPKRITLGGYVHHVLNRANGRLRIFKKPGDFEAFERILAEGCLRIDMRICGYCIMGNHWHLLLWPRGDDDLSNFMRWITLTHTQRFHTAHDTVGCGHLYQGRYKSFPVQDNTHYLTVLRYIEANPLRAKLVETPEQYPWSSFAAHHGHEKPFAITPGPVPLPSDWPARVASVVEDDRQQAKLHRSLTRGVPFGEDAWTDQTARHLGLQSTLRRRGRPRCFGSD